MAAPELPLAVTAGEPGGIGPDLLIQLANDARASQCVAFTNSAWLHERAALLGVACALDVRTPESLADWQPPQPGTLAVIDPTENAPAVTPGQADRAHAAQVLACIDAAADACVAEQVAGMVTGPVAKRSLLDAGYAFRGHTEHLAAAAACDVVMLLAAGDLRVALATTHIPLKDVPGALNRSMLTTTLDILERELATLLGRAPRIRVLGLNPHAGEGGHLGREEGDVIAPVVADRAAQGAHLEGPVSADTAFVARDGVDCFLAMYHDQGLPVLKTAGFGQAVNITLGLPYVRTSVDHGTALTVAGTGNANAGSLFAAIDAARTHAAARLKC